MSEKKVKPVDNVTVYATDKLKSLYTAGSPIELHSIQAEKLIKNGKATKDAPEVKKADK
jgi:hypothetical protein